MIKKYPPDEGYIPVGGKVPAHPINSKALAKVWWNGVKPKRSYKKIIGSFWRDNKTDKVFKVVRRHKAWGNRYAIARSNTPVRYVTYYSLNKKYEWVTQDIIKATSGMLV